METSQTHPTADRFAKTAHETVDKVHASASRAEEQTREKAHAAKVRGEELGHRVTDLIRERPLVSIGIAAAVGVALGALLGRHHHHG